MLWEAVVKHLGKINQGIAGLVLGVALVWAVHSLIEGRLTEGLLALVGALVLVVFFGAVGVLVQIRDLLAEGRD
ncbi:MAG: hypothetical protein OXG13_00660 [Gemmatimonadaceae bacterium]|nr:hypothetical protein [Gemmatimonadaceae bacterium]